MIKEYVYTKKRYVILFKIIDSIGTFIFGMVGFFINRQKGAPIKKIAVVELAHIGDVLAITPALDALRKKFPEAWIAAVVSPWGKDIMVGNPDVSEIIVYRASWLDRVEKKPFSLSRTLSFINLMHKKRFDLGIDIRGDCRSILLMWFCGIKKRVGYGFAGGKFLLTDVKPFDVERRQDKHQVDHNIELVRSIEEGKKSDTMARAYKIFFSNHDVVYIDTFLEKNGISKDDVIVAFHCGSGLPTKQWPIERFALLIEKIINSYCLKIIVVGGSEEEGLAERLTSLTSVMFINAVGKTNIKQLAALLKRCRLFVGGDSGVMHVASAVKTPIVAIWGGHNKPEHWRPLADMDIVIYKHIDCRPCGRTRCSELTCLSLISIDEVFSAFAAQMRTVSNVNTTL
jgi:lipopolysaccharide heptosyltransferase II